MPGFPSLFLMYGPNTNTSGGSIIVYLEAQAGYIRQALEQVRDRAAAAIDVRPEVEAASDRELQARFAGTAWTRCDSWYRDERGRIVTNWPGYMREYVERTRELDPGRVHVPLTSTSYPQEARPQSLSSSISPAMMHSPSSNGSIPPCDRSMSEHVQPQLDRAQPATRLSGAAPQLERPQLERV